MPTYAQHFKAGATLVHALYTIDEVYADDKVDWDDAGTIASFIAWEAVLWGTDLLEWRNIHKKPLYIIEAAIIAGGVVSYAIAGREGLMNYADLMTGKVSPGEYYEVVAPQVTEKFRELDQVTDEWSVAAGGWIDDRLMDVQHYLEAEYQEKKSQVKTGWDLLQRYGRWANPTWGLQYV